MKKSGFTLAEVLLTLAIIGVVAALTIPAVITKVTQDQYVTGLKKAYNTLKAVEREAIQEHGPMENWEWGNAPSVSATKHTFEKYFKPYFDIMLDCNMDTPNSCFASSYNNLYGDYPRTWGTTSDSYKIITSDGIAYSYTTIGYTDGRYASIYVDLNGPKKGPNQIGRDFFEFTVVPTAGWRIKPRGSYNISTGEPYDSSYYSQECNPARAGFGGVACSTKILSEGAMNY